jgi:hypothetical protein
VSAERTGPTEKPPTSGELAVVVEISRITRWGNHLENRRRAGLAVADDELAAYQQAKTALLSPVAAAALNSTSDLEPHPQ